MHWPQAHQEPGFSSKRLALVAQSSAKAAGSWRRRYQVREFEAGPGIVNNRQHKCLQASGRTPVSEHNWPVVTNWPTSNRRATFAFVAGESAASIQPAQSSVWPADTLSLAPASGQNCAHSSLVCLSHAPPPVPRLLIAPNNRALLRNQIKRARRRRYSSSSMRLAARMQTRQHATRTQHVWPVCLPRRQSNGASKFM